MNILNKKINILGLTQGSHIDLFINLIDTIKLKNPKFTNSVAALVSFARYFENSSTVRKNTNLLYLKEWEIFDDAKKIDIDIEQILDLNNILGENKIWKCIVGDRRLIYGKHCKSIEDYKTRYSDKFLCR